MNKKALVLLSGGLDSTLAAKMMLDQGIELEAVNFMTVFCTCTRKSSCGHEGKRVADELGIKLHVMNITEEYLGVVKNPRYGYGRNMNPCVDCRIFMFSKAKEFMENIGASFIVTGEVLGERPMSQRRDAIKLIEEESGLRGLILRPLCAKYFQPTLPEEKGIVNRKDLLDIKGRSRKPQMALAKELGIDQYLCPGGGCLLTDQGFSKKAKDLIKHDEFALSNIKLLKVGRHFRLNGAKIVIGRDKEDNDKILALAEGKDILVKIKDFPSPITLVRGNGSFSTIKLAAALTGGYTKGRNREFVIAEYWAASDKAPQTINVKPLNKEMTGAQGFL